MTNAAAYFNRAGTAIRTGDVKGGIAALEAGLQLDPAPADQWYNLGYLRRCDRQFVPAIAAYEEAIRRSARGAQDAWVNIAIIYYDHLQRADQAISALQNALAVCETSLPALLNLGMIYEETGRAEEARSIYQRILAMDATNGRARGRLTMIDIFQGEPGRSLASLDEAFNRASNPEDRADLAFALGHALDALGRYKDAFKAFQAANDAAAFSLPPALRYRPDAHENLVAALIEQVKAPLVPLISRPEAAPIFICGMFRSGSTLVEQLLSRHSAVTAGGELECVPALMTGPLSPYPASLAGLADGSLKQFRTDYCGEIASLGISGRWTDKRPDNFLYLPIILGLFPDARIVHTTRNPKDNLLSVFFGNFDAGVPYGFSLRHIAHWHRQYEKLMAHWEAIFGEHILQCSYDQLVRAPHDEMRRVVDHCGLAWEENCARPDAQVGAVRTLSSWQVRQPLHSRSSERWRHYADDLPAEILTLFNR